MLVLGCGVQVSKRLQAISMGPEIILAQLDYTTPQDQGVNGGITQAEQLLSDGRQLLFVIESVKDLKVAINLRNERVTVP